MGGAAAARARFGGGWGLDGGGQGLRGTGRSSGWRPELAILAMRGGREREERAWEGEIGLQVSQGRCCVSARLRALSGRPKPESYLGHKWIGHKSVVHLGDPVGSTFTYFFPHGHVRAHDVRLGSPAGDILRASPPAPLKL
jgi:hypothetical protein